MKRILSGILLCLFMHTMWAQQTVSAHIVDSETREELPYAKVYCSNGKVTLSNLDGDFTIHALPSDSLEISFIGYRSLKVAVSRLPHVIRLKQLSTEMRQVEVLSDLSILEHVARELAESHKKGKRQNGQFFLRTTEEMDGQTDMTEAFLLSGTAVHLHGMSLLNGRRMKLYEQDSLPYLGNMNMHHILEIGPMMSPNKFWDAVIDPPFNGKNYRKKFECQSVMRQMENGNPIYRIQMKSRMENMECVMYVDGRTWQTLRFEGKLMNVSLHTRGMQGDRVSPIDIFVTVEYDHTKGFAEVENVHYSMKGWNVKSQGVLLNMKGASMDPARKGLEIGENLAESVDKVGYDSLLWANSDIIQRTSEEEQIAHQHALRTGKTVGVEESVLQEQAVEHHDPVPADTLKNLGRRYPQEIVYVHMDNTCYFLGDTLYYKAYVVRSDRGTPSDISQILYAELLNQDGYLVERQTLRMKDGQADGSICLTDSLYAGFYELRAYTRWQLNWGRTEHPHNRNAEKWFLRSDMATDYFRDYDKLYSRVFPVYDKPKEKGE